MEDCIEIEKESDYFGDEYISGWHLKNTTTIKLTETKMWLKRSESEVGYKQILSLKEPELANDGEDCWENCIYKQGPCGWCGKEGMCCSQKSDWEVDDDYYSYELGSYWKGHENGCDGTFGGLTRFECVLKQKKTESKGWL